MQLNGNPGLAHLERMVVDVSYSKEPYLRTWLAESWAHQAVLVDTFAIESHQADSFEGLLANYQHLAEYAGQVVVLHPTARLVTNRPRRAGASRRMIDEASTGAFDSFCVNLRRAPTHPELRRKVLELNAQSTAALALRRSTLRGAGASIESLAKTFDPADLKSIRKGNKYTSGAAKQFLTLVNDAYEVVLEGLPSHAKPKHAADGPYSYVYRLTLCTFLAALTRIADGNPGSTSDSKIGNDFLDAYYCAAALFFDGLWTNDTRARDVLGHATALMSILWGVDCCRAHSWKSGYEPRRL